MLTKAVSFPEGPFLGRTITRLVKPIFNRVLPQILNDFKQEIEKDYQAHTGGQEHAVDISDEQILEAAAESLRGSADGL
jgi:hypothetical protein